ncbi:hypothetical protein H7I41_17420 [Mycobacterium manitobense]|uniref:Secreted protein n=1 Tax=[Mycobacterium] manitobense TaxID=190147 RepID=A0A9X2YBT4_9MYCO|nr:hypothetical protein [[Mycobacterium] manitobense]MCV7171698.1 hypothetical protein [[Mycobacterium] manitobense]
MGSRYLSASALIAVAGVWGAPVAVAQPPPGVPPPGVAAVDAYPLAEGRYTTTDDYGWVYFKTPDGRSCGVGPNGGPVGCDAVALDAPAGLNQTVVNPWGPGQHRRSTATTFTRDVDVLPEGHRLENMGASCAMGFQGAVTCQTYGQRGFVLSALYTVFW